MASSEYTVYAINECCMFGLVASLAVSPSCFCDFTKVGVMWVDACSCVIAVRSNQDSCVKVDSMIRMQCGNGVGGVCCGDTQIQNFTTCVTSVGSAITYTAQTATTADLFTINCDGVYHITTTAVSTGCDSYAGISLNSSETSTIINSIIAADRLSAHQQKVNGDSITTSWAGVLCETDIIRAHVSSANSNCSALISFTITKIGDKNE